jgi:hypothetical protein
LGDILIWKYRTHGRADELKKTFWFLHLCGGPGPVPIHPSTACTVASVMCAVCIGNSFCGVAGRSASAELARVGAARGDEMNQWWQKPAGADWLCLCSTRIDRIEIRAWAGAATVGWGDNDRMPGISRSSGFFSNAWVWANGDEGEVGTSGTNT